MKEQDAAHSFKNDENECVFYLDNESVVFGCECGNIEIGGKTYYPEEKLTRLRSELQQKDEVIKEIYEGLQLAYGELIQVSSNPVLLEYKKSVINKIESLIKKAKAK